MEALINMSTSPNHTNKQQDSPAGTTKTSSDDISEDEIIAAIATRREEPIEEVAAEIKPMLDRFDVDEIIAQQVDDIWF